jgi:hypothetical protein
MVLGTVEVKNNLMRECFAIFFKVTDSSTPMSGRRVTNRRPLLLPLLIPDRYQPGVVFDACVPSRPATTINDNAGESLNAWPRHSTSYRGTKLVSQTTEVAIAELIARDQLLARLVFQRIRPATHLGIRGRQNCSPDEPHRSGAPAAPPDMPTSQLKCAAVPTTTPVPPTIETLLTQLVRRRLRSRATQETR